MKKSGLFILFLNVFLIKAQPIILSVQNTDSNKIAKLLFKSPLKVISRIEADSILKIQLNKLLSYSFLEASVDSQKLKLDTLFAFIHTGNPYFINLTKIYDGNIENNKLVAILNKNLTYAEIRKWMSDLLEIQLNSGYPFAKVYLDSFSAENKVINACLIIDKGTLFLFDTLNQIGSRKLSNKFLQNYLKLVPGKYYNETAINKSTDKLKALGLVIPLQPVVPFFSESKCIPIINLKYLARDEARALLGINQNESTGKTRLSGEVYLHLHNLFYAAREFELLWQSWRANSQLFKVNAVWPFPFQVPLILKASGGLLKYDTLFSKLNSALGFEYPLSSKISTGFGIKSENTILTYADTAFVRLNKRLPENIGLKQNAYYVDFKYNNLDFVPNPLKGFYTKVSFSAFQRKIKKDLRISAVIFNENGKGPYTIYDSLSRTGSLMNTGFELDYLLRKFTKISAKSTFLISVEGKLNKIPKFYLSDLYRIGGNISLRGFNEQGIFATSYHFMNFEWRYLFGERSFVSLFYNAAAIQNNSKYGISGKSWPTGFGTSVKFSNNNTTFSLAYALGKQKGEQFEIRNAKIHIGVINNF